jgi:integrase
LAPCQQSPNGSTKHIDDLTGVTDRTRQDYRRLAAKHIAPTLGPVDVDQVTPADVARWANQLEQTVSAKTIANLRALLSAAFGYAVDEKLRGDNPMRRLRRSRAGEHERPTWCAHPAGVQHLRSLLPEHWRPFATFLAGTGLRFGEAVALRWRRRPARRDPDRARHQVVAAHRRTASRSARPSRRKSRRTSQPPDDVVDVLAPLVTRPGGELLFLNPHGNRVLHANLWNRVWKPAVGSVRRRHRQAPPACTTCGTATLRGCSPTGVPLTVIQDRLGHESITTTVGVYRAPDARPARQDRGGPRRAARKPTCIDGRQAIRSRPTR